MKRRPPNFLTNQLVFKVAKFLGIFPVSDGHRVTKLLYFRSLIVSTCFVCFSLHTNVHYGMICCSIKTTYMDLTYLVLKTFRLFLSTGCVVSHIFIVGRRSAMFTQTFRSTDKILPIRATLPFHFAFYSLISLLRMLSTFWAYLKVTRATASLSFLIEMVLTILLFLNFTIIQQPCKAYDYLGAIFSRIALSTWLNRTADSSVHYYLLGLLQNYNNLYGLPILLAVANALVTMITCGVFIYLGLASPARSWSYERFMFMSTNVLCFMQSILLPIPLIASCARAKKCVDAFHLELFKLMKADVRLCHDKKLNLYVTARKTINFSACGFFDLGHPLFTSIMAAGSTYLVILVQFSLLNK